MSVIDFIQGQEDCRNGIPHQAGKPEDYDRGYGYEYEKEQLASEGVLSNDVRNTARA